MPRRTEKQRPVRQDSSPVSDTVPVKRDGEQVEFFNRDLSWLEFNRRVLNEALDPRTPLLERVGFLSIFNSNLDEYFQKRVGALKAEVDAGVQTLTPDGMTPTQVLAGIRKVVGEQLEAQGKVFTQTIVPELKREGIFLLGWEELTDSERDYCRQYFRANIFPVVTPLAVDPSHPFPFISNLSLSVALLLRVPLSPEAEKHPAGEITGQPGALQFARIKVPKVLPRWVRVQEAGKAQTPGIYRYVNLANIVRHNLPDFFEGMKIEETGLFKVTRSADASPEEDESEDLLEVMVTAMRQRKFAACVRLETDGPATSRTAQYLAKQLELDPTDVYQLPSELDFTDLKVVQDLPLPKLKYEPWTPVVPSRLTDDDGDIFHSIRQGDILVHHPYESFSASVEGFIKAAAKDPKVLAIKLTLYRTSPDSPFIPELIRAADSGKQVVALVELKARFDEERNMQLAQVLEKYGIHVVYGLVGLKTHTKTSLVVRHESDGMRCYAHIGTGNYNSRTANVYTDLGLFTCNPEITQDLVELFHFLTGRNQKRDFRQLLIAPVNMKRRFVELIDREINAAAAWRQRGADAKDPNRPRIVAKMNSLEDRGICRKLYEASQAGVKIQLIVRGFCCLRPGVPGMSENITVTSTIGRFLEHSRIYYFHNGGASEYYIGSADWMYRNLNNRVECITPIHEPSARARLREVLDIMLADQRQTWDLSTDGVYTQRKPDPSRPESAIGVHQRLMGLARS